MGWTLLCFPVLWAHAQGHLDYVSSSLTSKRRASLSRNLRSTAWLVCSSRHFLNGSRACPCSSFQGHLSPSTQVFVVSEPSASVSSVPSVSLFLWVSARFPVTALWRTALRASELGGVPRIVRQWLFLAFLCFLSTLRVVASLDLWGSSVFACSSGWCVPCSLGPVRVPLPAWTSLVLCCVLSATQCPVITHVVTEKNGWVSKPGVLGGHERDQSLSPLLLPRHSKKHL